MTFITAALAVLGALSLIGIAMMIKGPTIFDRLLMLDMLSAKVIMAITLLALMTGQSYMLDIAICYTLLSFITTVLIARFVGSRGNLS